MDPAESKAVESLLAEYAQRRWQYEVLAQRVRRFLDWKVRDFFGHAALPSLHLIQARAKQVDSLRRNLLKGKYKTPALGLTLAAIGDLAAVRVILYFADDLAALTAHLRRVDTIETWFGPKALAGFVDKALPDPSSFGYESVHFPVHLEASTVFRDLVVHDEFGPDMRCEVQLRTLLQHAWAEAEHDLVYKATIANPNENKRRWALLAASIRDCDDKLSERKREFVANPPELRDRTTVAASEPTGYLPLHSPAFAEPTVVRRRDLFDVDAAIERRSSSTASLTDYKRRVFDVLDATERELIRGIDRDELVVRMCAWDEASRTVCVQPALYSDGVVTNNVKTLERSIDGVSIRSLAYDAVGELLPFADSPMANTVGVALMIKTVHGDWLLSERAARLAYQPGSFGCSVSGALAWSEIDRGAETRWLAAGEHSARREAFEELGIVPHEPLTYLGTMRELLRAGKPQMFFAMRVSRTKADIRASFRVNAASEYEDIHFVDEAAARLVAGSERYQGRIVSKELREALALAIAAGI